VTQNQFWPVVSASPDAIRIFAEGGWGVQAAQKSNTGAGKDIEWQLYLMKHSAEEISETSGTMGTS
jgi:hypothetical protein